MSEKESFSVLLGENNSCATAVAQERIVIVMKVRNLIDLSICGLSPYSLTQNCGVHIQL